MSITQNRNFERTGDRDLRWSEIARLPKASYLGSMDVDVPPIPPQYWCTLCKLPIFIAEVTREVTAHKATTWTESLANKIGVDAYLFRHGDDWIIIQRLFGDRAVSPKPYTIEEFHMWVEGKYFEHIRKHQEGIIS